MFASFLFSKNVKYIGYVIIFIMVAIPIGTMFNELYINTIHMFGGETDKEKIQRLTTNEEVLVKSIESKEKEKVFIEKKTKVLVTVIKSKEKKAIKLEKKKIVVKKKLKKKITKAKKKRIKKTEPIVTVIDKVVYEDVGNVLIDSMDEMYELLGD